MSCDGNCDCNEAKAMISPKLKDSTNTEYHNTVKDGVNSILTLLCIMCGLLVSIVIVLGVVLVGL